MYFLSLQIAGKTLRNENLEALRYTFETSERIRIVDVIF